MLQLEMIRPSKSNWSSSLHMVLKADSSAWWLCGDSRELNVSLVRDCNRISHLLWYRWWNAGYETFNQFSLNQGVLRNLIQASAVPFALCEFTRKPFGLRNAAQSLQRLRCLSLTLKYSADVLIAIRNMDEHLEHHHFVFEHLKHYSMKVKIDKYIFSVKITFSFRTRNTRNRNSRLPVNITVIKHFSNQS